MKKLIYLIFIISFISIVNSCEKPEKIPNRTPEQKLAINNDTLLLNFIMYMDSSSYKINFAKDIVSKKIVKMSDGLYKYEINLANKQKHYAEIKPSFLNDSLISIRLTFNDNILDEIKDILLKKYGETNDVIDESMFWYNDDRTKSIYLFHIMSDVFIEYSNPIKQNQKDILDTKNEQKLKDSLTLKIKKDL